MKKVNIDGLLGLNLEEIEIVYRRCKREKVGDIAKAMEIGESTIWNDRMRRILEMLEVENWKEVEDELCQPLRKIIFSVSALKSGWPESFREEIDALRETAKEQEETSLEDTSPTSPQSVVNQKPQEAHPDATAEPTRVPHWALFAVPILILCILCISGGFFGWRFLQPIIQNAFTPDLPTQSVQPENTNPVVVPATDSPTSTFTALATETILPTATPAITDTPFPTPSETPPPYYTEKMAAELKTGVFLVLNPDFGNPNYVLCIVPRPGFSLKFDLTNNSSDEFLMRFNWYEFSVVDDQGKEYEVNGAGVNGCPSDPGLRSVAIGHNSSIRIFVSFAGEIGVDARYLLVTVENISGYGPFVFRKDF